jgi:BCD family chlorophyll transporter-like MFS transporter
MAFLTVTFAAPIYSAPLSGFGAFLFGFGGGLFGHGT